MVMIKGSPEAKAWGAKMKRLRKGGSDSDSDSDMKGQGFDDVKRSAKAAFQKAVQVVKPVVGQLAKDIAVSYIKSKIPVQGGALKDGIPQPLYTHKTMDRIMTHGLTSHRRGTKNGLMQGGSFLPLG